MSGRKKGLALGIGVALLLGATLGSAGAHQTTDPDLPIGGLCGDGSAGCNMHFVGNQARHAVAPDVFMQCLPAGDWIILYVWDEPTQNWLRYANTAPGNPGNLPAYLNDPATGAATEIPGLRGIALLMRAGAPNEQRSFLHSPEERC